MEALLLLFAIQQVASYAFSKGLDNLLIKPEGFVNRLMKIIQSTIEEYELQYPIPNDGNMFPFYHSKILIEEFLKFRLFSAKGFKLNMEIIQLALEQNSNILKPSEQELECFFQIFDNHIAKDDKLKLLEIEEFHKEVVFETFGKVEQILNLLEVQLVEVIPLLETEYQSEINMYVQEIRELLPRRALKHLISLEKRVIQNSKHVSDITKASLKFIFGICFEALGQASDSYESFIKAYKLAPQNKQYLEKACVSYYLLGDYKYKSLKIIIEKEDDYNEYCWVIRALEAKDLLLFIKKVVPQTVLKKNRFKRMVFNSNLKHKKVDIIDLIKELEVSGIRCEFPEYINYDNFHHWVFLFNTISILFFQNARILYTDFVKKDENSMQFLQLSRLLAIKIKNSEMNILFNEIVFMYYWIESEIDNQKGTLNSLKQAFYSINEKKSFQILLFANSIQKRESKGAALEIIKSFNEEMDEDLISLKTYCQLEDHLSESIVIEYFSLIQLVDEYNIQNTCSYIVPMVKSNVIERIKFLGLVNGQSYNNELHKELVLLLVDTLYDSDVYIELEVIDTLKDKLIKETNLFYFISLLYFENKYFDSCIKFQETFVNEEVESIDLVLYIIALDSIKNTNQLKLLRLLSKWRKTFSFNSYFLRIEIELFQILKDWKEIEIIAEYALTQFPDDEPFYTMFIYSLSKNGKMDKLEKELSKIERFQFDLTENALTVASVLKGVNFFNQSLEIVYKKAINKDDSIARMNFLSFGVMYPNQCFEELNEVIEDCYVKFDIDGEEETIFINSKTDKKPIVEKSMGKSVSDVFTIESNLTRRFRRVRILRIMNKYSALRDNIFNEANSSFSNLPIESLTFESTDMKSFEKVLIENFGANEEKRRSQIENNLSEYYNYKVSFSDLVVSNFDESFIDAYYTLTSKESDGFLIKPLKYFPGPFDFDCNQLVIDFTSGLLFFELSKKFGIKFKNLLISKNIYSHIDNLIRKTKEDGNSKLSVNFSGNRIIPFFYPEDFQEKRLSLLRELKDWFQKNSEAIIPEEKLEIMRTVQKDSILSNSFEYIVDTAILSFRQNHLLITDDMGYEKMLKVNNWVTTEKFLRFSFPERANEILEFLLTNKYVGLTVNTELLYTSYINQNKQGLGHIYSYAMRNLGLPVNFVENNIYVVVQFLKKIALNTIITEEKYKMDATNILVVLTLSLPSEIHYTKLEIELKNQFHLMGNYLNLTKSALFDAVRINTIR